MTAYQKLFHGIDRAAYGYFFLYFNINIDGISLLPTFVGYLLFLSAIGLMAEEERELSLLRPLAILLATWHGLDWFLSFLNIELDSAIQFLDLLRDLANVYFHFQLLTNLAAIAARHQPEGAEMDAKLLKYRTLQTVMITGIRIISCFSVWFESLWSFVSGCMAVVYLIAGVCLMKALFDLRRCLPVEETPE